MKQEPCPHCGTPYPHPPWEDGLFECRTNLEAEVERLRDALESIADGSCYDTVHDIRQIARAALMAKEKR